MCWLSPLMHVLSWQEEVDIIVQVQSDLQKERYYQNDLNDFISKFF